MTSDTRRLFFALWPDETTRAALHAVGKELVIRMNPAKRRIVPPENLHLTVQFLGGVNPEALELLLREMRYFAASPISLRIDVARSFTGTEAWWVGPQGVPEELRMLRAEVGRIAGKGGIALEGGRFVPHITLLRAAPALPPTTIRPIAWKASTLSLIESQPSSESSVYTTLESWELKAAAQGALF